MASNGASCDHSFEMGRPVEMGRAIEMGRAVEMDQPVEISSASSIFTSSALHLLYIYSTGGPNSTGGLTST